ncbi:carboxylesterase [Xylogone sp. PMI_703]|nr:carboxylesterase [Xylogone sp. PMI_703]
MKYFNALKAIGVLAFHVASISGAYSSSTLAIDLGYVRYQGIHNSTSGINAWYGIRYARPPTGQLRWQAPQDIETSNIYSDNVTINATQVGPSCVQGNPAWNTGTDSTPTGDEDCLLLDILVPANPVSSNLPVMVQIHGGGYTIGSSETIAPGNSLVYQSNGSLIYVSIQYRLGAYGFLGGAEVLADGVANVGLLDQRAALNWVQRYISRFGGDPSKVTIIGGSAGGGSVTDQMILYGGMINPPFRAAIAEYPWWQPFHNDSVLQRQYNLLLNTTNCGDLGCLRSLPAILLANATAQTYILGFDAGEYGFGDFYYGPYVDGFIIRDLPSQEFKQGHFTKVPLMTNREGYEGITFSNQNVTTMVQESLDLQTLFPYAKQSFFSRLYDLYPRSSFNSTFYQRAQLFGDFIISCPSYYMATTVSDLGIPVYKLIFDAGSQLHGSLIPFTETINLNGEEGLSLSDVLC